MWTGRIIASASLCLVLLAAFAARADETNPGVQACKGKSSGDACTYSRPQKEAGGALEHRNVAGTCQPDECCELDYSKGSPPTTHCGPCLACKAGGGPDGASPGGPDGESPRAGDEPPAPAGSSKRCAIGDGGALWACLLLFGTRRRGRRGR